MRKVKRGKSAVYCDVYDVPLRLRLNGIPRLGLTCAVLERLEYMPVTQVIRDAARAIVGSAAVADLTKSGAVVVLAAIGVADGVHRGVPCRELQLLAALVCQLPLPKRALLYYDACDRLGYDPAEGF